MQKFNRKQELDYFEALLSNKRKIPSCAVSKCSQYAVHSKEIEKKNI